MGVDLFFVLSGFLIGVQVLAPLSKGQKLSLGDFYVRRALRILPAFLVVLALYMLWPGFRESAGMEPWWKFVSFTMNLTIDYAQSSAFSHAWSLCVEEHFYLTLPMLAVVLTRRPAPWKFAVLCLAVILGSIALRAAAWTHGVDTDPTMVRNWFVEDIYYPTWNRLDGLLCGVALAVWKTFRPESWRSARRHANTSLFAGVFVMALSFMLFLNRTGLLGNTIGWPILSLGLGLLVFAGAGHDSLIGRRAVPAVSWIAAISYSLYLVHKATYHIVQANWGEHLAGTGIFAFFVYGGMAILAGAALHYAVERPFLKLRFRLTQASESMASASRHEQRSAGQTSEA